MNGDGAFDSASTPLFLNQIKGGKKYVESCPADLSGSVEEKKDRNFGAIFELRKTLIERRRWLVDVEFVMAMAGIVFMMAENELFYNNSFEKGTSVSLILKTFTTLTTAVLLVSICLYYHTGIAIRMVDGKVDDPFAVTPVWTWVGLVVEILVCAVHPFPGDVQVSLTSPSGDYRSQSIDGILSVVMMFRLYLVGRFVVVHNRLLTDSSTQNIGAVSKVKVNMTFVFKAAMADMPGILITLIMLTMYSVSVWSMRTCELYYTGTSLSTSLSEAMWLSAMTFLTVGYGDLTPTTQCGRFIAVATGLGGLATTALLVAVTARRLEQTRSERYVHSFHNKIHLLHKKKNAAANIVKYSIKLWTLKCRPKTSSLSLTITNWKLRNAIRTIRLTRFSLAEHEDASVSVIEVSDMVSRLSDVVDSSFRKQKDLYKYMQKLETDILEIKDELRKRKS
ncbi:small conductance calcium-activated potassium channel protein 2-like isoform X2 [Gigantopelta aegis]|nr:small conductance calcium-activated potassium channel protein 2-like isoform X2 [Gigantopelta aegis]